MLANFQEAVLKGQAWKIVYQMSSPDVVFDIRVMEIVSMYHK